MNDSRQLNKALLLLVILVLTVGAYGSTVDAKSSYFKGKTIVLIIPASPGGGMDFYGRTTGRYIAKKFGATFVAKNVPGSGGILATNKLARAKANGLTIGSVNLPGLMFAQMLGEIAIRFKLEEFNYIGRPESEPAILFVGPKSGIKSVEDIAGGKKKFTMGFSGLASDDYYFAKLQIDLIKAKMKPIAAYDGASEVNLATVKGDIDSGQASYSTMRPLIEAGEVIPIMQLARKRIKALPNVPTASEAVPADKRDIIEKILDLKELGARTWAAPKGVPADRIKTLQDAYWEVMHNPNFLKDMARAKRLVAPLEGAKIQRMVNNVIKSAELKSLVQQFKK